MGKNIAFIFSIFMICSVSSFALADGEINIEVTATKSTNNTSTNSTSTQSAPVPSSGLNYGPGYADEMAKKKAAEKAGCVAQVNAMYASQCTSQANMIYSNSKNTCNSIVQGGAFLTGVSTLTLNVAGKPTTLPTKVIFGMASIGLLAGGSIVSYGTTTCRDNADADYKFNINQCTDFVNSLKVKYCS